METQSSTTRRYEHGRLVAFAHGATIGADEQITFANVAARGHDYVIAFDGEYIDEYRITATTDDVAVRFAAQLYTGGYTLLRRECTYTEIATVEVSA